MLCFVDRASLYNLVNKTNLVHNPSLYVYFYSLCVSGTYAPIIRRNNCISTTPGICHSVWMTVWNAVWDETSFNPPCIPDGHPHRVRNTRCRIDIIISPDDGHIVARNIQTYKYIHINTQRRNCAPGWFYLQD
jgi:hypothetical protein